MTIAHLSKRTLSFAFLFVFVLMAVEQTLAEPAKEFVIVQDGRPMCQIVAAPEICTQSDTAAALELRRYIQKMTGVELPIYRGGDLPDGNVIVVGKYHFYGVDDVLKEDMSVSKLGREGYLIRHTDNQVILFGQGWDGPYYAVYAFLEQLGCRFYGYSEVDEIVPKTQTLSIHPQDVVSKPAFMHRDLHAMAG